MCMATHVFCSYIYCCLHLSTQLTPPSRQPEAQCKLHYVVIPRTKLYYLAPELIRVLSPCPEPLNSGDFYPYSEKTDVYAFG